MNIGALILNLLHDKLFRLNAVYPFRQIIHTVVISFTSGGVYNRHAACLRKTEQPAVLIGSDYPVGNAIVIQLEGVIRHTPEEAALKQAYMAV